MTMSWTRFASSTLSWSDKRLRDKIVKLFAETSPQHRPVYTFNHLYQVVKPTNATQLAMVLTELVKSGVLRRICESRVPRDSQWDRGLLIDYRSSLRDTRRIVGYVA